VSVVLEWSLEAWICCFKVSDGRTLEAELRVRGDLLHTLLLTTVFFAFSRDEPLLVFSMEGTGVSWEVRSDIAGALMDGFRSLF
jgi:hypothetical protein